MCIAVIGPGYVGLVSGGCFSEFGVSVTCVDKDAAKIARLQRREVPTFEPGLEALVTANAVADRLASTTDLAAAVAGADAVFIAVGTPSRRGDGHADLSYVFAAAEEIGRARLCGGDDQVDVAGRHRVVATLHRTQGATSTSLRTRSFCARARRSRISFAPTGW
jgi:UDP-glucose 6-dehydrogenase